LRITAQKNGAVSRFLMPLHYIYCFLQQFEADHLTSRPDQLRKREWRASDPAAYIKHPLPC
jgi:hypothetical protein